MFDFIPYTEIYVERVKRCWAYTAITVENPMDKEVVFREDGEAESFVLIEGHGIVYRKIS